MIKDGGLSLETELNIEFLQSNNSTKKCLEISLTFSHQSKIELVSPKLRM